MTNANVESVQMALVHWTWTGWEKGVVAWVRARGLVCCYIEAKVKKVPVPVKFKKGSGTFD